MTDSKDSGFTLTELLVVVVVVGIVASVLAAVFSVIVRTAPSAQARADDSRSLLGITTYFPEDVSSTPRKSASTPGPEWDVLPGSISGCSGGTVPGSTNLIKLRWSEATSSSINYEASYRFVNDGGWRIQRVSCANSGTATFINVTTELPPPSASPVSVALVTDTLVNEITGAQMSITTLQGDTIRVDATSNSLNQTLSTVPVVTTTSTTSIVTCSASFVSVVPSPVQNQPKGNGKNNTNSKLSVPVTVTINRYGNCSDLRLEYRRETGGSLESDTFGGGSVVVLQSLDTQRWEDGSHVLTLRDAGTNVTFATSPLVVT